MGGRLGKLRDELVKESSFTYAQIQTLELSRRVRRGEITVKQATQMRKIGGVKVGSYYRVLGQARGNLRRTAFTLILATRLEMINVEDLIRLLNMVRQAPEEMSEENFRRFTQLINQIVGRSVVI